MWYPIRCKTIDVILENKDEVMNIVCHDRISKVATAAGSIVGGGLIGVGLFLAIPTWGASLSLSVVGGAVSSLSVGTSLISFIALQVKANNRLKKAQQFVELDQQFSNQLNDVVAKYSKALEAYKERTFRSISGISMIAGTISEAKDLVEKSSKIALQAACTILVVVALPIDVVQFINNFYLLYTGRTDSNTPLQLLIKQFEACLKGQYISFRQLLLLKFRFFSCY